MAKPSMPKGLEALFGTGPAGTPEYGKLPVETLEPNPYQPRHAASDDDIEQLAASIKRDGMLQPVVVSRKGERNIIIAGERRWRAARRAGLQEIPVVFREADDREMLICALLENLQRRDLSPVEEARAYDRLRSEFSLSEDKISGVVGKSRPHISNLVRLLELPAPVQNMVHQGMISAGHGKVLLTLGDQKLIENFAYKAVREGLSVRALERAVREVVVPAGRARRLLKSSDPVRRLAQEMSEKMGRRIWIQVYGSGNRQHGRIILEFHTPDDFESLRDGLLKHFSIDR